MALETATYISDLNAENPATNDPKSQGDDHLRLIKTVLKNTFAGFPGLVVATGVEAQGATANDYTLTLSPVPAAYTSPMLASFKATHANTGAATLQIGALGTKPLIAVDGTALKSGDIENGGLVAVFYDGTSFFMISGNDRANRNGDTYSGTHDFTGATLIAPGKSDVAGETYSGTHNFSGATVVVATQVSSDNSTNPASTAFVQAAVSPIAGSNATSTSSLTIGTGAKSLTIQTGKNIVVGMFMTITSTASPENWMHGEVTSYDSGTGALIINVETATGAGTISAWTLAVSGPKGPSQASGATTLDLTSGNATLTSASDQVQTITAAVSGRAINLPNSTSMTEGGFPYIISNRTGHNVMLKNNSGSVVRTIYPSTVVLVVLTDAATNTWGAYRFFDGIETGLPSVFESATTYYTSVAMLDSSKAVVTYTDNGNSNYGTACVLSISGTTVTAGTPVVFESATTYYTSVAMLDSSKAVVTYQDGGNSNYGTACVLSISGTTVTAGTPAVFEAANSPYTSVAALNSSKAVVTYTDNGNSYYGTACVLSISGTTVTAGTPVVFESATTYYTSVAMLDSSKAVVTYTDDGNSSYGTACVLSISGTTVTAGTPVVFESAAIDSISVAMLDSSKAVVTYRDGGNSNYGTACVLSISGTTVTAGTPVVFESANTGYTSVAMIDSSKAVVTYQDVGNSYYGTACVLFNM
jgi:hypothetical protein